MERGLHMRHLVRPLAAVTITAAAASLGATALPPALGWLHARVVRSDRSLIVRISSERIVGLYPGAKRELVVTFHNRSKRRTTVVRDLHVGDVVTTNRRCAGTRRNLRIRQYGGPPIRLRP